MKTRCLNPNAERWKDYGGRGIRICERWLGRHGFSNFVQDMGVKPSRNETLDRIDVNGDYEPSNCRWASNATQARNKRNNHLVTHNGETKTISEWSETAAVSEQLLRTRFIRYGWDFEKSMKTPPLFNPKRKNVGPDGGADPT